LELLQLNLPNIQIVFSLPVYGPNSPENTEIPPRLNLVPQWGTPGLWLVFSVLLSALTMGMVAGRTPGHHSMNKLFRYFSDVIFRTRGGGRPKGEPGDPGCHSKREIDCISVMCLLRQLYWLWSTSCLNINLQP